MFTLDPFVLRKSFQSISGCPSVNCSAYGSSKAENYSPDRATSHVVVDANLWKTRQCVRKIAFHDADY